MINSPLVLSGPLTRWDRNHSSYPQWVAFRFKFKRDLEKLIASMHTREYVNCPRIIEWTTIILPAEVLGSFRFDNLKNDPRCTYTELTHRAMIYPDLQATIDRFKRPPLWFRCTSSARNTRYGSPLEFISDENFATALALHNQTEEYRKRMKTK